MGTVLEIMLSLQSSTDVTELMDEESQMAKIQDAKP